MCKLYIIALSKNMFWVNRPWSLNKLLKKIFCQDATTIFHPNMFSEKPLILLLSLFITHNSFSVLFSTAVFGFKNTATYIEKQLKYVSFHCENPKVPEDIFFISSSFLKKAHGWIRNKGKLQLAYQGEKVFITAYVRN